MVNDIQSPFIFHPIVDFLKSGSILQIKVLFDHLLNVVGPLRHTLTKTIDEFIVIQIEVFNIGLDTQLLIVLELLLDLRIKHQLNLRNINTLLELNQHQIHFSQFLQQLIVAIHIVAFIGLNDLFVDIESGNQTMLDVILGHFEWSF